MSKKEQITETPETAETAEDKIVTRYDRRMQKRKDKEEKEKKEEKIARIVGIVIAAAIVCLIASFPIRTLYALNSTFIKVDDKKVTKLEFDYNYSVAKNNYTSQYSYMLSYMGLDLTKDLSTQMYSDTLTWEDFFQQMTVENMKTNAALIKEAKAEGFVYDTTQDYADYEKSVQEQAASAGITTEAYIKNVFGSYATMKRLKGFVEDSMYMSAYYNQVAEGKAPSDDEITAYYEENKDSYDCVDYRLITVDADLPEEPTELADKTEDVSASDVSGSDTEEKYQPSEAEIEAAMKVARQEADDAEKTIKTEGKLTEKAKKSGINSTYSSWLFEADRKEGDTTIVEDTSNNRYFVVEFVNRYRDDEPSADIRAVVVKEDQDPQSILDEWDGTEEGFIALCDQYSENTVEGGLYEGITNSSLDEALSSWLFGEERKEGDTTALTLEDGTGYVLYYVAQNDPEWKLNIRTTLINQAMSDYVEEISAQIEVEDPEGNLNYLKVLAAQESEAAQESTVAQESSTADVSDSK